MRGANGKIVFITFLKRKKKLDTAQYQCAKLREMPLKKNSENMLQAIQEINNCGQNHKTSRGQGNVSS